MKHLANYRSLIGSSLRWDLDQSGGRRCWKWPFIHLLDETSRFLFYANISCLLCRTRTFCTWHVLQNFDLLCPSLENKLLLLLFLVFCECAILPSSSLPMHVNPLNSCLTFISRPSYMRAARLATSESDSCSGWCASTSLVLMCPSPPKVLSCSSL